MGGAYTDPLPIVGVELGSRMESTALCVTERVYVPTAPGETFNKPTYDHGLKRERLVPSEKVSTQYRVRHLQRLSPPCPEYGRPLATVLDWDDAKPLPGSAEAVPDYPPWPGESSGEAAGEAEGGGY